MPLNELRPHLFTIPEYPDWVPYRTSYYKENWGFCLSHKQIASPPGRGLRSLHRFALEDGHLTYGECHLPGNSRKKS